ncbi:hypothetical protein [Companilactobacillus mishanensis]|uniref:Lipoprotein n=1 Tax=Companilactobacillus mishanensis TaxID=2486008 RepID=A0ABW9P3I6_9LACO|nr:hypothetical protein [Companilactobacillus mishanensis]MQS43860.1 hypothetical protein [Companilactobacillus mishanensis]
MKKKYSLLLVIVMIVMVLAGCSNGGALGNNHQDETVVQKAVRTDKAITMTDILNSKKPVIMYQVYTNKGKISFGPRSVVTSVLVCQNGKATSYWTSAYIKDFDGLSEKQILSKVKKLDKSNFKLYKKEAIRLSIKGKADFDPSDYEESDQADAEKALSIVNKNINKLKQVEYKTPVSQKVRIDATKSYSDKKIIAEDFDMTSTDELIGVGDPEDIMNIDNKDISKKSDYASTESLNYGFYETVTGLSGNRFNYAGYTGKNHQLLIRYPRNKSVTFNMDTPKSKYLNVKSNWN